MVRFGVDNRQLKSRRTNACVVWLDVVNDADPVPDFNGLVVCKISRVQRENSTRPAERTEAPKPQVEAPDLIETSEPPPSPSMLGVLLLSRRGGY
jgi:hypothetical protein